MTDTPSSAATPPRRHAGRRRGRVVWRILAVLVVLVAAAYGGVWFYAAGLVRDQVEAMLDDQRAQGAVVEAESFAVEGFPFDFRVRIAPGAIRRPDGVTVEAGLVSVAARPWAWNRIGLDLSGLRVTVDPGAGTGAVPLSAAVAVGDGELVLTRGGDPRGVRLSLEGVAVDVGDRRLAAAETAGASVDRRPDGSLGLAGSAREVTVPMALALEEPFGDTVDRADLAAALVPEPPSRIDTNSVRAWRDAGGRTEIERLSLAWGPLTIEASGTLTLDDELQPQGELTATIEGLVPLADALEAGGILEARPAAIFKAGASLFSGRPIPLSIQGGKVSLGPFEVPGLELPRIVWPGA